MSEQWTKERIEEWKEWANTHNLTPRRIVCSALSEIERLQSENAKLKELIGELVEDDVWWWGLGCKNGSSEDISKHLQLIFKAKEMMG